MTSTITAPETAPARVGTLNVHTNAGLMPVTAERTVCEHLRITPVFGPWGELTGDWRLTHAPTGLGVPGTDGLEPRELRDLAHAVADLPFWAFEQREAFVKHAEQLHASIDEARDRITA